MNILGVLGVLGITAFGIVMFNALIGFEIFQEIFSALGISFNPKVVLTFVLFFSGAIVAVLLAINYAMTANIRYEFQNDKLVYFNPVFMVLLRGDEIPYENILSVTYKESVLDKILSTGTIIISLSWKDKTVLMMSFIDNAASYAASIPKLLQTYRYAQQAQFERSSAIGSILDKEVY